MASAITRRGPGSGPTSYERLQYGDLVAFYVEDKVMDDNDEYDE